ISYYEGDTLYVALPYVQKYTDFTFEGFDSPAYVYIVNSWDEQTQATVNKDTKLRIKGGVKSEILESVEADETVIVLEEMETWTKVETARGLIGYIENKRLDNIQTVTPTHDAVYIEPEYTSLTRDYKINMGFNAIGGEGGNDSMESLVASTKSLNVISPTWYALSDNLGNIRSYASADYVTKAHALGLEVWALVDNFTGPEGVSTQEVLSHASSRQTLITNLIDQAGTYGFDGINIDFESIDSSYAQSYIEFIREISIACRANGLVLSIDNYVPMNFNDFYDLEEQGTVADYVVIMGYDEHYAGSEEAGSVASIGYVENGIKDTVEVVDPSKVINAIPFYTRIWKTQGGSVSSQAVVMDTANEYIATHGIEMKWDDTTCQNYGEFTDSDGSFVQIWLEDAQSISAKLSVMSTYNIAGVAEWELGFETADVWDEIEAYIGG
nr:chitinase [Lachnospiraceae bacterium]